VVGTPVAAVDLESNAAAPVSALAPVASSPTVRTLVGNLTLAVRAEAVFRRLFAGVV
jgi:hypothetical protein